MALVGGDQRHHAHGGVVVHQLRLALDRAVLLHAGEQVFVSLFDPDLVFLPVVAARLPHERGERQRRHGRMILGGPVALRALAPGQIVQASVHGAADFQLQGLVCRWLQFIGTGLDVLRANFGVRVNQANPNQKRHEFFESDR